MLIFYHWKREANRNRKS